MPNGVQFEDENYSVPTSRLQQIYNQELSALEKLVVRTGIVSTAEQAKYVLMGVICICVITTIFISVYSSRSKHPKIPPGALERMKPASHTVYPNQ